jgi:glycosyltransferase involved in cell wall biosynthesis
MDMSVVVSTRNRADDLRRMLESLAQSHTDGSFTWEIVVADNGSTDTTAEVLRAFEKSTPVHFRWVHEPRPGKSYGLASALALATGAIIAFTDDDILVDKDWVAATVRHFAEHPESSCIGGRIELFNPDDAPVAIKLSTTPKSVSLATFSPSNIPVAGCNMAMRAELLRRIGPFDPDISPGSRIGVAEDLDILYRVVCTGASIEYLPHLLVHHNHGRRTVEHLETMYGGYYAGRGAFYAKYVLRGDRLVTRWAYWELHRLLGTWTETQRLGLYGRSRRRSLVQLVKGAVRYVRWGRRAQV